MLVQPQVCAALVQVHVRVVRFIRQDAQRAPRLEIQFHRYDTATNSVLRKSLSLKLGAVVLQIGGERIFKLRSNQN